MKITEFKKGDIIHRLAPSMKFGDRSFIEEPIEFLEVKSGLIFFRWLHVSPGKIGKLGLDAYDDDQWDYFPKEYLEVDELQKPLGKVVGS